MRRLAIFLGVLVLVLVAVFFAATGIGAVDIALAQTLSILLDRIGIPHPWFHAPLQESVLLSIRLPGVCLALLTGAAEIVGERLGGQVQSKHGCSYDRTTI